MLVKISKERRIILPSDIYQALELKDEVELKVNSQGVITLTNPKRKNLNEIIETRLNKKDLTKSERNFLEHLKEEV